MRKISRNNNIPLFLPGLKKEHVKDFYVLSGDIGGTKTNLSICKVNPSGIEEMASKTYPSENYSKLLHILEDFIQAENIKPERLTLGVAGPVVQGRADLTNLGWVLDSEELKENLGISHIHLLNDLEATAYGLAVLEEDELVNIHPGNPSAGGNMAIIAPGTGLGEAGLYFDGECFHPFPTEGGHCDFSPRTAFDVDLHNYLSAKYGVVSWEKLISGPAIVDIYEFIVERNSIDEPKWIKNQLQTQDPAAVISTQALEKRSETCVTAMDHFIRYLARECSSLVLKMKSTGGLFIGGGIPPKILPLIKDKQFMKHFMDCDRMEDLQEQVPIKVIMNDETAMLGAACFAAFGKW